MNLISDYLKPEIIVPVVIAFISLLYFLFKKSIVIRDKRRLYKWVSENTNKREFRSIKTIASKNHMTIDYAEKVLSSHKKLRRGLGTDKDIWTTSDPT